MAGIPPIKMLSHEGDAASCKAIGVVDRLYGASDLGPQEGCEAKILG